MKYLQEYEEEIDFSVTDVVNYRTVKAVLIIFVVGFVGAIVGLTLFAFIGYQPAIELVQFILQNLIEPEGLTRWIYGTAISQFHLTGDPTAYFFLLITNNFLRIILSSIGAALFWVSIIGFYKYFIVKEKENRNLPLYISGIIIFIAEYIIFDDQFTISALILLPLIFGGIYWLIKRRDKSKKEEPFINIFLKISIFSVFIAELLTFVFNMAYYFVWVPAPFVNVTEWFTTVAPHLFIEIVAIILGTAIGYFIAVDMSQALDEDGIDGFLEEGEAIIANKQIWKALLFTLGLFVIGALVEAYFSIGILWGYYPSTEFTEVGNLIWDIFLNWGPIIIIISVLFFGLRETRYWPLAEIIIILLITEGIFFFFNYLTAYYFGVMNNYGVAPIHNPDPAYQAMGLHFIIMTLFFSGEIIQNITIFSLLIFFVVVTKLILDYRKKNMVYSGSIENPITRKGIFNPFSVSNTELLKKNLINGIFPIIPMILLIFSIHDLGNFEINIIIFLFIIWRFRGTTDEAMTLKIVPLELDEHGNVIQKEDTKKKAFMNIIGKLYYVGMFLFNIYSIYTLYYTADPFLFINYTLLFVKQLVLAIVLLPFLTTFGSIFLIKARQLFMKLKVNLKGQFVKAFLYSIPISILAVGILIGLSFLSTFLIFGTIDFNIAISIATSFNLDTTYVLSVSLWLVINVLIYFSIFIVIGYVAVQVSLKYKISKVYIIFCTICLSFPVMWILLPATHYLVSGIFNVIYSGQNMMLTYYFTPILPDIPTTLEMTPWLLLNSVLGGLWGLVTFFPVFLLITIRSFSGILGFEDVTEFLSQNYAFFPNLYYQNFIFLLNFSLFLMGAIIISYYVFYVRKLDKKKKKRKYTSRG